MKVVIIGADNSGKSNLASNLAGNLGYTVLHREGPGTLDEMKKYMEDNLNRPDGIIFDRLSIIEEAVYGRVLRNCNKFNDEKYNKEILDKVDLFIYCNPGLTSMLNWGDREQMDGVKENAINLINEYNKVVFDLIKKGYKVIEFNYNIDPYYHDIIKKVRGFDEYSGN